MKPIINSADLKILIQQLEQQQAVDLAQLKEVYDKTCDSLKPINIIKSTFKQAVNVPDLKTGIINTAIGLTTGILAKKIVFGKTINPLSKMAGVLLEVFVADKTTRNADEIKSIGSRIMNKLFNRSTDLEKHDGKSI